MLNEPFKRNCLLIGLVTVLVTGTLLLSGCTKPTLGEAQIVVYERGEKTIIDSKSPYFKKLQAACEEMLTSAESLYYFPEQIKSPPDPEELKNEERAIELTYGKPIEVSIILGIGPTAASPRLIETSQFLMPLTGKWSQLEALGVISFHGDLKKYVCLFLFPEIVYGDQRWEGLIGTKKDVQKIKDILTRFDINVP